MSIRKVGVLGCGLMGSGIAEVAAKAGLETVVREVSGDLLDKGLGRVRGSLERAVEKGKLADLVVLQGDLATNPSVIRKVTTVFKDGVGYDSAKLIAAVKGRVGID